MQRNLVVVVAEQREKVRRKKDPSTKGGLKMAGENTEHENQSIASISRFDFLLGVSLPRKRVFEHCSI